MKSAAADAKINLKFSDAQQKQENQIKAIRSYIAQKVDVIAFSPVVESGWEPVLLEAKAAKIPVILTDRNIDVKDKSLYVTMIGSDFMEAVPEPRFDRALMNPPFENGQDIAHVRHAFQVLKPGG